MTRKIFIMMVLGIFALAMPGTVLAGHDGMGGYHDGMGDYIKSDFKKADEAVKSVDAGTWPAGEQVETGAVPMERSGPSLIDTHHDPFNPNLREIDRAGSRGG